MKKRVVAFLLAGISVMSFSFNAFAYTDVEEMEARKKFYETHQELVLDSDPMPIYEGKERAAVVTDSYVNYAWIPNGNFLQVDGYVTMKDGSNDAYHYTRVECQHKTNGQVLSKSDNEYGWGKVWAYTPLIDPPERPDDYKGRVYYGQ